MDDVTYSAVWPNGAPTQMDPSAWNPQAGSWADVLMYGLASAASNAAYNLSNSVGTPPRVAPTIGLSVGASGNFMPLLILGALAYVLFKD
ncbi:hypothetical protein [Herbaspirillum huttiense]|uniref:hypothetical protein n=1 Tax=Herbaspirillum huttiense TaxID=863372 RepID=UPI0031E2C744